MGEEKPSCGGQPPAALVPVSWDDVGSDRTFRWKRRPLEPLVDNCSPAGEQHLAPAAAALRDLGPPAHDNPSCASVKSPAALRGRLQRNGPPKEKARDVQGSALKAEGTAGRESLDIDGLAARQQQQQAGRGGVQDLQQGGVVMDGRTERRLDNRDNQPRPVKETGESNSNSNSSDDRHPGGRSTDFGFRPHTDDGITHIDTDVDVDSDTIGAARRAGERRRDVGAAGWNDSNRVRGFHDMICVGFAVSLCLNLGSLTARRGGFFAAEVECLPEGAAQTVLPDLGIWVGWRQAVANDQQAVVLNLEDLSMVGAAMGVLTVLGHATDAVLNAVGLAVLLYGRRKPLQEAMCRLVKRLCLASLAMAGWLMGMTVIGFLVAVKGPIGAAAVDFYTDLSLYCRSSVSVSVDYAYAMTTLTVLCQFFIGVVALPTLSSSSYCGRCCNRNRWGCRGCRLINPVGCCFFFLWRATRCCFPSSSAPSPADNNDEPPHFSGAERSSGMGATRGGDKSGGGVTRTERSAGRAETRPARFDEV